MRKSSKTHETKINNQALEKTFLLDLAINREEENKEDGLHNLGYTRENSLECCLGFSAKSLLSFKNFLRKNICLITDNTV